MRSITPALDSEQIKKLFVNRGRCKSAAVAHGAVVIFRERAETNALERDRVARRIKALAKKMNILGYRIVF